MSQRHRTGEMAPVPRAEVRAHAHHERQRVHERLRLVEHELRAGTDPDDVTDPAREWRVVHHHDPSVAADQSLRPRRRHWKLKAWKRRSARRRARAREEERLRRAG